MRTERFEEVINAVKRKNTQPMIDYIISKWQVNCRNAQRLKR